MLASRLPRILLGFFRLGHDRRQVNDPAGQKLPHGQVSDSGSPRPNPLYPPYSRPGALSTPGQADAMSLAGKVKALQGGSAGYHGRKVRGGRGVS